MNTETKLSEAELQLQKKGRRTFLLLALFFFGPLFLAPIAHKYNWFSGSSTVNYGELVKAGSALDVVDKTFQVAREGKAVENIALYEKWNLIMFIPNGCDEICIRSVRELEAAHFLLNRDIQRVQLLTTNEKGVELGALTHGLQNDQTTKNLLDEFSRMNLPQTGTYLVDPKGFLVTHYPQVIETKKFQKDLKRLLKYSRIG